MGPGRPRLRPAGLQGHGRRQEPYASTYPNIGRPRVHAEHALACREEGYLAYKINPHYFQDPETGDPTPGPPSNIKADIETCHLVREAVGRDTVLIYDVRGPCMSMEQTATVGRKIEKLGFAWFEHPMPEYRVKSYVRVCREPSIPVLAPEIAAGGVSTRAEWILRMAGFVNLQVCGATPEDTSAWNEKGRLGPGVDYDAPHPYLCKNCGSLDTDGLVNLPTAPGLRCDIVWDHIDAYRIAS